MRRSSPTSPLSPRPTQNMPHLTPGAASKPHPMEGPVHANRRHHLELPALPPGPSLQPPRTECLHRSTPRSGHGAAGSGGRATRCRGGVARAGEPRRRARATAPAPARRRGEEKRPRRHLPRDRSDSRGPAWVAVRQERGGVWRRLGLRVLHVARAGDEGQGSSGQPSNFDFAVRQDYISMPGRRNATTP
jgi:hypothetical protein